MPEPDGPQFVSPHPSDFPFRYESPPDPPPFARPTDARPWGKSPYLDALELSGYEEFGAPTPEELETMTDDWVKYYASGI
jgi:hypothetical protein